MSNNHHTPACNSFVLHATATNTNPLASSLPPAGLATLIAALHARPFKPLSFAFAPALLFASYVNLAGFPTDSAGLTCAWSGVYLLAALRRRQPLRARFSVRGLVRGAALGLAGANCVAGGYVYSLGNRKRDEEERIRRNRWQE